MGSSHTLARKLEQAQVIEIERPGGISGFTTFYATGCCSRLSL
jgi:hypothetical protein